MDDSANDPAMPSTRPQVLYIEDDATHRTLMQALFKLRPHLELVLAADGAEATALAPTLHPSLLLLDIRLSDCLGSELLPLLRLRFGWSAAPAVAVTGEPGYTPARGPFDEVWTKPLDLPLVLHRLDHWLPIGRAGDTTRGSPGTRRQSVTPRAH
jgi:CheY-like chemotaxis protein